MCAYFNSTSNQCIFYVMYTSFGFTVKYKYPVYGRASRVSNVSVRFSVSSHKSLIIAPIAAKLMDMLHCPAVRRFANHRARYPYSIVLLITLVTTLLPGLKETLFLNKLWALSSNLQSVFLCIPHSFTQKKSYFR